MRSLDGISKAKCAVKALKCSIYERRSYSAASCLYDESNVAKTRNREMYETICAILKIAW